MCECEFDPYPPNEDGTPDEEESWHFRRTCAVCGNVWYGLHCPHDGYQNPCPECRVRPAPVELQPRCGCPMHGEVGCDARVDAEGRCERCYDAACFDPKHAETDQPAQREDS